MAQSSGILSRFKRELQREAAALERQLSGIQTAINALEFGTGVGATAGPRTLARSVARDVGGRKRRRFSAATRRRMAAAQRARWAKAKAAKA